MHAQSAGNLDHEHRCIDGQGNDQNAAIPQIDDGFPGMTGGTAAIGHGKPFQMMMSLITHLVAATRSSAVLEGVGT